MKYARSSLVLSLGVCAGGLVGVASADEPLVTMEPNRGRVIQAAHIYYNIATGEQIVTRLDGARTNGKDRPQSEGLEGPSGLSSGPIWSSLSGTQCPDPGTTSFFFVVDDNAGTSSLATGFGVADWGDIATDSVVDMVHVDWITGHADTDIDSDGIGDGVVGLGGRWTYWDVDNGPRADYCIRLPLISFEFVNLPGNTFGDGFLFGYSADIDLAGSFSNSLTFEIGDSDGDLQGAAFGNNNVDTNSDGIGDGVGVAAVDRNFDGLPDADIDGDGLFDWAWTVRFYQPGTHDFDGDGVLDGDFADSMKPIGISFGSPEGTAIDNGDGTWTWEIDPNPSDAGTGAEDAYARIGDFSYVGSISWFGGFSCEPGNHRPRADFEAQLIGPGGGGICRPDLNGDGVLNFFDVSQLILVWGDFPDCDYNGDGECNFFDISEFMADFVSGCNDVPCPPCLP
jgi:hypothetical protein